MKTVRIVHANGQVSATAVQAECKVHKTACEKGEKNGHDGSLFSPCGKLAATATLELDLRRLANGGVRHLEALARLEL